MDTCCLQAATLSTTLPRMQAAPQRSAELRQTGYRGASRTWERTRAGRWNATTGEAVSAAQLCDFWGNARAGPAGKAKKAADDEARSAKAKGG